MEVRVKRIFCERLGSGFDSGKLVCFIDFSPQGVLRSFSSILKNLQSFESNLIYFTGKFPKELINLIKFLVEKKFKVVVDCNSNFNFQEIHELVFVSLNLFPPSSNLDDLNDYDLIKLLEEGDQLKIVIRTKRDYLWLVSLLNLLKPNKDVEVVVEPFGGVFGKNLWRWASQEGRVRVLLDLNKIIKGG